MTHFPIPDANELIIDNLERNLFWAGKLLTGQAILFIRVFPTDDHADAFDRPVTVQELEMFGKLANSVVVHASLNGEMPDGDAIHDGLGAWLGDIVDGHVACGALLVELCPSLK